MSDKKPLKQTFRDRIAKLFEKYDIRDPNLILKIGKRTLFGLVLFVEILVVLQFFGGWTPKKGWISFFVLFSSVAFLAVSEGLKLFTSFGRKAKLLFFGIDFLCAIGISSIVGSSHINVLYLIVLTDLYCGIEKNFRALLAFAVSLVSYILVYSATMFFRFGVEFSTMQIITQAFGSLVALTVHFLIVRFLRSFYRQYLRLEKALKDLDQSNAELEKAYAGLKEATALAERQRIAKNIHDTAGHSITTVIMQTEVAKLIIDKNPTEAKKKIIAANLQAKHTLEELRESVHLLSGISEKEPLKSALQRAIGESTDGTDLVVRSYIEDVDVSDDGYRLLYNTLKEGISNGLRHGKATAFWFELKTQENEVLFLLSDNGQGVDESFVEGFGLGSMRKEAERLGGEAFFVSEKDEGFEIHLRLPVYELNGEKE